jgi:hypothetical protein
MALGAILRMAWCLLRATAFSAQVVEKVVLMGIFFNRDRQYFGARCDDVLVLPLDLNDIKKNADPY